MEQKQQNSSSKKTKVVSKKLSSKKIPPPSQQQAKIKGESTLKSNLPRSHSFLSSAQSQKSNRSDKSKTSKNRKQKIGITVVKPLRQEINTISLSQRVSTESQNHNKNPLMFVSVLTNQTYPQVYPQYSQGENTSQNSVEVTQEGAKKQNSNEHPIELQNLRDILGGQGSSKKVLIEALENIDDKLSDEDFNYYDDELPDEVAPTFEEDESPLMKYNQADTQQLHGNLFNLQKNQYQAPLQNAHQLLHKNNSAQQKTQMLQLHYSNDSSQVHFSALENNSQLNVTNNTPTKSFIMAPDFSPTKEVKKVITFGRPILMTQHQEQNLVSLQPSMVNESLIEDGVSETDSDAPSSDENEQPTVSVSSTRAHEKMAPLSPTRHNQDQNRKIAAFNTRYTNRGGSSNDNNSPQEEDEQQQQEEQFSFEQKQMGKRRDRLSQDPKVEYVAGATTMEFELRVASQSQSPASVEKSVENFESQEYIQINEMQIEGVEKSNQDITTENNSHDQIKTQDDAEKRYLNQEIQGSKEELSDDKSDKNRSAVDEDGVNGSHHCVSNTDINDNQRVEQEQAQILRAITEELHTENKVAHEEEETNGKDYKSEKSESAHLSRQDSVQNTQKGSDLRSREDNDFDEHDRVRSAKKVFHLPNDQTSESGSNGCQSGPEHPEIAVDINQDYSGEYGLNSEKEENTPIKIQNLKDDSEIKNNNQNQSRAHQMDPQFESVDLKGDKQNLRSHEYENNSQNLNQADNNLITTMQKMMDQIEIKEESENTYNQEIGQRPETGSEFYIPSPRTCDNQRQNSDKSSDSHIEQHVSVCVSDKKSSHSDSRKFSIENSAIMVKDDEEVVARKHPSYELFHQDKIILDSNEAKLLHSPLSKKTYEKYTAQIYNVPVILEQSNEGSVSNAEERYTEGSRPQSVSNLEMTPNEKEMTSERNRVRKISTDVQIHEKQKPQSEGEMNSDAVKNSVNESYLSGLVPAQSRRNMNKITPEVIKSVQKQTFGQVEDTSEEPCVLETPRDGAKLDTETRCNNVGQGQTTSCFLREDSDSSSHSKEKILDTEIPGVDLQQLEIEQFQQHDVYQNENENINVDDEYHQDNYEYNVLHDQIEGNLSPYANKTDAGRYGERVSTGLRNYSKQTLTLVLSEDTNEEEVKWSLDPLSIEDQAQGQFKNPSFNNNSIQIEDYIKEINKNNVIKNSSGSPAIPLAKISLGKSQTPDKRSFTTQDDKTNKQIQPKKEKNQDFGKSLTQKISFETKKQTPQSNTPVRQQSNQSRKTPTKNNNIPKKTRSEDQINKEKEVKPSTKYLKNVQSLEEPKAEQLDVIPEQQFQLPVFTDGKESEEDNSDETISKSSPVKTDLQPRDDLPISLSEIVQNDPQNFISQSLDQQLRQALIQKLSLKECHDQVMTYYMAQFEEKANQLAMQKKRQEELVRILAKIENDNKEFAKKNQLAVKEVVEAHNRLVELDTKNSKLELELYESQKKVSIICNNQSSEIKELQSERDEQLAAYNMSLAQTQVTKQQTNSSLLNPLTDQLFTLKTHIKKEDFDKKEFEYKAQQLIKQQDRQRTTTLHANLKVFSQLSKKIEAMAYVPKNSTYVPQVRKTQESAQKSSKQVSSDLATASLEILLTKTKATREINRGKFSSQLRIPRQTTSVFGNQHDFEGSQNQSKITITKLNGSEFLEK